MRKNINKMVLWMVVASFVMMNGAYAKSYSREYGVAGCGLGAVLIGKKGGQIFAATTNGTLFNQSFGITFGTLNCDDSAAAQAANRLDIFVSANKVALANDIARGGGETLVSITNILNCESSSLFNSAMQQNFAQIFPSEEVAPNEITDSIFTVILNHPELAKACNLKFSS
jgi:Protein of unknown function (DUF3015)